MLFFSMSSNRTRNYPLALTLPAHALTIVPHGGEDALPWVGGAGNVVRSLNSSRKRMYV